VQGAFLNYPGAQSPAQPFLFIQSPPPPAPSDEQLAFFHETRKEWDQFVTEAVAGRDGQLRDCPGGSYHVTLNAPGFEHMSFTDQPLLASAGNALRSLQLAEGVTREFFDKYLKASEAPTLDGLTTAPETAVKRYLPR
jgi:hypothetical protein